MTSLTEPILLTRPAILSFTGDTGGGAVPPPNLPSPPAFPSRRRRRTSQGKVHAADGDGEDSFYVQRRRCCGMWLWQMCCAVGRRRPGYELHGGL